MRAARHLQHREPYRIAARALGLIMHAIGVTIEIVRQMAIRAASASPYEAEARRQHGIALRGMRQRERTHRQPQTIDCSQRVTRRFSAQENAELVAAEANQAVARLAQLTCAWLEQSVSAHRRQRYGHTCRCTL